MRNTQGHLIERRPPISPKGDSLTLSLHCELARPLARSNSINCRLWFAFRVERARDASGRGSGRPPTRQVAGSPAGGRVPWRAELVVLRWDKLAPNGIEKSDRIREKFGE